MGSCLASVCLPNSTDHRLKTVHASFFPLLCFFDFCSLGPRTPRIPFPWLCYYFSAGCQSHPINQKQGDQLQPKLTNHREHRENAVLFTFVCCGYCFRLRSRDSVFRVWLPAQPIRSMVAFFVYFFVIRYHSTWSIIIIIISNVIVAIIHHQVTQRHTKI